MKRGENGQVSDCDGVYSAKPETHLQHRHKGSQIVDLAILSKAGLEFSKFQAWMNKPKLLRRFIAHRSGSSSVVERQLPKLNVAGSIPVSRSNPISQPQSMCAFHFHWRASWWMVELSLNCHGVTSGQQIIALQAFGI